MGRDKFDKKFKEDLAKDLLKIVELEEDAIRQAIEDSGIDPYQVTIINKAKFFVKYMPDVMEQLLKKYGTSKPLMDDPDIRAEAHRMVEEKFLEEVSGQVANKWNIRYIKIQLPSAAELTLEPQGQPCPECNDVGYTQDNYGDSIVCSVCKDGQAG